MDWEKTSIFNINGFIDQFNKVKFSLSSEVSLHFQKVKPNRSTYICFMAFQARRRSIPKLHYVLHILCLPSSQRARCEYTQPKLLALRTSHIHSYIQLA